MITIAYLIFFGLITAFFYKLMDKKLETMKALIPLIIFSSIFVAASSKGVALILIWLFIGATWTTFYFLFDKIIVSLKMEQKKTKTKRNPLPDFENPPPPPQKEPTEIFLKGMRDIYKEESKAEKVTKPKATKKPKNMLEEILREAEEEEKTEREAKVDEEEILRRRIEKLFK